MGTADEQHPGSGYGGGQQKSDLRIRFRRRGVIPAAIAISAVQFGERIALSNDTSTVYDFLM